MGQQNTKNKTQDTIQKYFAKLSQDYAKRVWIHEHYRVGEKIEQDRWMHSYLIQDTLCTTNCEIVEYIWMKINGLLKGDERNSHPIDINTVEKDYKVYNINNYITEQAQWDKIEW